MAVTADKVVVELELKDGQYLAKVKRAGEEFAQAQAKTQLAATRAAAGIAKAQDGVQRSIAQTSAAQSRAQAAATRAAMAEMRMAQMKAREIANAERQIKSSSDGISQALSRIGSGVGLGATTIAATRLADAYTNMQNRLRVTGLSASAVKDQFEELNRVADSSRSGIQAITDTYSRLRIATEDMGFTNADVTRTTEILSKALKSSGATAQETSAALLQFGQGIGSGALMGDELRSIRENAPLVARAIADEFGVTIGELKKLGEEGKLTSERVVSAVLKSGTAIDAQWATTEATVGDALTNIQNKLVSYIGQADESLDATDKLRAALNFMAANIDGIIPALGVLSVGLGVQLAAKAFMAKAAVDGVSGALVNMRVASLAAFGGPVGIAIMGVTAAISAFAFEANSANADLVRLKESIDAADDSIHAYTPATKQGANETKGIGNEAVDAAVKIDRFAGAVGDAAQKLYDLAKARQAAALSDLEAQRLKISTETSAAQQRLPENIVGRLNNRNVTSLSQVFEPLVARGSQLLADAWTGGGATERNRRAVEEGTAAYGRLDTAIERARSNLEQFAQAADNSRVGTGADSGTSARKAGGKTEAEKEAERSAREEAAAAKQLRSDLEAIQYSLLSDAQRAATDLAEQVAILKAAVKEEIITLDQAKRMEAGLAGQGLERYEPADIKPIGQEVMRPFQDFADELAREQEQVAGNMARTFTDILASGNIGEAIGNEFKRAAFNGLEIIMKELLLAALPGESGRGFLSQIFGFGGNRANGGGVRAGSSYTVGENGRETFVPSQNGYIIPNMKNMKVGGGQPSVVKLIVDEGSMFSARVQQISGPIAVQASVGAASYSQESMRTQRRRQSQSFV